MGLPKWLGYVLFFVVPTFLWLLAAAAAWRRNFRYPFLAYIGGSDGRASLARLQAFMWTMIIFGAFAAAMAIHKVKAGEAVETLRPPGEQVQAQSDQDKDKSKWVAIPPELLLLAGIAISSGVFSSLIAVVTGEEKTAMVKSLTKKNSPDVRDLIAEGSPTGEVLVIEGENFGSKAGSVRLSRAILRVYAWDDKKIIVNALDPTGRTLIVDTSNGKACAEVKGTGPEYELQPVIYYELVDLFRDDKSPGVMSLMKFQMFAWTLVATVIYSILFLKELDQYMTQLPTAPATIAALTGISQAGYLAGKGASAASAKE